MKQRSAITRRDFLRDGTTAGLALLAGTSLLPGVREEAGRLTARLRPTRRTLAPGEHVLADDDGRRSILFVPSTYDAKKPAPFLLALHGATGSGDAMLAGTQPAAEKHGVVVLAPSSRGTTWDAIRGPFSADLARIDRMLGDAFDECAIDPFHVGIGGFSDGGSYALSLGIINGDLFTHIIGHSPGFIIPGSAHGRPKIYLSHGRQDQVLPIDQCSRRIAAQLTRQAYVLRFDEFDGGHKASQALRETAMQWFVG
jgi:phospholipase/carboxylesterase